MASSFGQVDNHSSILVVESNEALAQRIGLDLRQSGYIPIVATDQVTAIQYFHQYQPMMVVIDLHLPGDWGLNLCEHLRTLGSVVPLLLLLQQDGVKDWVACLESGADDYLLKPYRSDDFLQRVDLYLQPPTPQSDEMRFGDLVLDSSTRQAIRNGRVMGLTMKEFELLKYLMDHPREVLTREQILENVWGYNFIGESNVIEVYIRYLRLKIEDEGGKRLIQTVRGVGYVLREN